MQDINSICDGCLKNEKECIKKNDLIQNFKIIVKKVEYICATYMKEKKSDYKEINIKMIQNIIKTYLFNNKPLFSSIYVTSEYQNFFRNKESEYFNPKEDNINITKSNHAIVILGWVKRDGIEYWIIRDTNYSDRFLKIAFSTISNIKKWLNLDIKFGDLNNFYELISLDVEGYYDDKKFEDYINEKIFESVNKYKDEL